MNISELDEYFRTKPFANDSSCLWLSAGGSAPGWLILYTFLQNLSHEVENVESFLKFVLENLSHEGEDVEYFLKFVLENLSHVVEDVEYFFKVVLEWEDVEYFF